MSFFTASGKPVPLPTGQVPRCAFCLHDEAGDLELIVDARGEQIWACRDSVWCDFKAVGAGLHLGEHIENPR